MGIDSYPLTVRQVCLDNRIRVGDPFNVPPQFFTYDREPIDRHTY